MPSEPLFRESESHMMRVFACDCGLAVHTDLAFATAVITDSGRFYKPQTQPSAGTRHHEARLCKPADTRGGQ